MSLRRLSLIAFCTLIALPLIAETRVQVASAHPRINGAAPSVDLLALKEGPSTVFAGRQITYTIDVFSYGPSPAIDVTLNDTIPAGTTFASLTAPNGWICTTPAVNETGQINCTTPLQGQGVFFSFFKLVLNGPTSSGTVTNTAVVSSPSPDPNPDNNSSTATTIVMPSANLEISKTGPATAQPGGDLTYHFVLSNTGEIAANQVFWDDKLPTGLRFVSIVQDSGPAFTCNPPPGPGGVGTLVCQIPTFPAGTSASFTLVEHLVDTFTSSSIQNFASVFLNTGTGLSRSQTVITAITPGNASNIPAISPLVLLLLAAALAVAGLMMRRLQ